MNVTVLKVNAFTESLQGGNPAGVVFDAPYLRDEQMKQISKELVVSETAFVFPSTVADFKVRFFSPIVEVDLCGHATIATFFTMASQGKVLPNKKNLVTQETKAGILPITIFYDDDAKVDRIMMTQKKPIYKNIHINISQIADSLNVDVKAIDDSMPEQIVSTGLFTLPICIKTYDDLKSIQPDFENVKKMCQLIGIGSFHVFTFETIEPNSMYHARNFAPVYGINEDPVTGTANGAVSSYLVKHKIIKDKSIICEQGDIIGRPGRVFVEIHNDVVTVGGKARIAQEREIEV
ncbi:MAG TPA: PhzF family phenazine biosynthesis protein [Candidatus Thermoplasmatota archaeon]|nr:PhzF family phenazine biosynthesis protein [Candidatus Thermoplasmatota archaeon]